jgi:hypothetical protein
MLNSSPYLLHRAVTRCALCDGKFGLVRHYSWRSTFCLRACLDGFKARKERHRMALRHGAVAPPGGRRSRQQSQPRGNSSFQECAPLTMVQALRPTCPVRAASSRGKPQSSAPCSNIEEALAGDAYIF